jgi:mRNA interferase RelE/StbE
VSYQVNWEIQALDQTAGFLRDDPIGVAALWDAVSQLVDEPRPPESFPYGSPDLRRLRAGRYRVFYQASQNPPVVGSSPNRPSYLTALAFPVPAAAPLRSELQLAADSCLVVSPAPFSASKSRKMLRAVGQGTAAKCSNRTDRH